jgi:serine/threonine-protein kinase RsbW
MHLSRAMQCDRALVAPGGRPGRRPARVPPPEPLIHSDSFPGRQMEVRAAIGRIMMRLKPLGLTADCAASTELVMAEVLNNVVEHAYARRPGRIDIEMRLCGDGLSCTVRDAGDPIPGGMLPSGAGAPYDVPVKDLPEGGFGWLLIRSLARDLFYLRETQGNRLTFLVPLDCR